MNAAVTHSSSSLQALQTILNSVGLPESVSLFASSKSPTTFLGCAEEKTRESIEKIVRTHFFKESSVKWMTSTSEAPDLPIRHVHLAGPKKSYDEWVLCLVQRIQTLEGGVEIDLSTMAAANDGAEKTHINLDTGTIYFSCDQHAAKASLLASIENVLEYCIIRTIQGGEHWPEEYVWFLKNLPQAVPELIDFMYAERVLNHVSREEVADLKSTYQRAQRLYGSSEKPVQLCLAGEEAAKLQTAYIKTHAILEKLVSHVDE